MENNKAQISFQNVCQFFDKSGWKYAADQQKLKIDFTVSGNDLDMKYKVFFDTDRDLFVVISGLPFSVSSEKAVEYAVAVNLVNDKIPFGAFCYNMSRGTSNFMLVNTFCNSPINEKMMDFFMYYLNYVIDLYNDKLYEVSKGYLNPTDVVHDEEGD